MIESCAETAMAIRALLKYRHLPGKKVKGVI